MYKVLAADSPAEMENKITALRADNPPFSEDWELVMATQSSRVDQYGVSQVCLIAYMSNPNCCG